MQKNPKKAGAKRQAPKRRKKTATAEPTGQTNEPFEHDSKRRLGQYGGTGEHPIKQ